MSMTDRQKEFEARYALDEELRFRVESRRNKLLGLWVAEKLGKSGDEAESYARGVVLSDLAEPGSEDVIAKVKADLAAGGVEQSDHQIRRRMEELLAEAERQVKSA